MHDMFLLEKEAFELYHCPVLNLKNFLEGS